VYSLQRGVIFFEASGGLVYQPEAAAGASECLRCSTVAAQGAQNGDTVTL